MEETSPFFLDVTQPSDDEADSEAIDDATTKVAVAEAEVASMAETSGEPEKQNGIASKEALPPTTKEAWTSEKKKPDWSRLGA